MLTYAIQPAFGCTLRVTFCGDMVVGEGPAFIDLGGFMTFDNVPYTFIL